MENKEARVETCTKCNSNCIMCPREKLTRPLQVMDFDEFERIIDQCVEVGIKQVSLFGFGEPLLDKELPLKIDYCNRLGMETFITTNAIALTPDWAFELMGMGLDHLRVSCHAINDQDWKMVHRSKFGTFSDVVRNTNNFRAIRDKYGYKCKIHVTSLAFIDRSVDRYKDLWLKGVDFLEIWRPHNWVGGRLYRDRTGSRKTTCGRPFNGPLQIQVDGTMIPCCFMTNSEYVYGDINQHSIPEILNGDAAQKLREAHTTGDMTGLPCDVCDQLNEENQPVLLFSNRRDKAGATSSFLAELEDTENGLRKENRTRFSAGSRS